MEGFHVVIDPKRMFAKIVAVNDAVDIIVSEKELLAYFKKNMIVTGILTKNILRAFIELHELTTNKEYVVAVGRKPRDGRHGSLSFTIDLSDKAKYFAPEDEDDVCSIDYKSAIGTPFIKEGECICHINKPTLGKDGHTIEGKVLPANNGEPITLNLGNGVAHNSDATAIIATVSGRPIYIGNKLDVVSRYEVKGDVCFRTGNINFDNHVLITGSVENDFSVDAESIEIGKSVGNSFIKSAKDLVIYGGVNGKNSESMTQGIIQCGGNMLVKYLNEAIVEVEGNLIVQREIVKSEVKCSGKVIAARIIGGTTTAFKGIEANMIGSEIGTPTRVEPGINYRIKYIDDSLANLSWQIDSIVSQFKEKLGDNDYFRKITRKNQERFILEYNNFMGIKEGYLELLAQKKAMINKTGSTPAYEVIVLKHLFPDVEVSTVTCRKKFMFDFKGPIILLENLPQKSIRIAKYEHEENANFIKSNSPKVKIQDEAIESTAIKKMINSIKKPIYTRNGLKAIDMKFHNTIYGQDFIICVFDDRHFKRVSLINQLKQAKIKNVHGVKDSFEALEFVKEFEHKKMVVICNLHIGKRDGLTFVSTLLHKAPNNYGIFLAEEIPPALRNTVSKIPALAIFNENINAKAIIEQIRKFGFYF